ncbi:C2 domain containing protein [Ophiocordyceps camponoti-floridani]|uniref:C2 domain containing protein n=1 Tax=Ophiocordyceps camponoti-floridani TaxID=2030778 RepID=A0A8H4VFE3_9HYPO|nr:C2 domain containing protein [Ophiocordyceps camponoti-floridani]
MAAPKPKSLALNGGHTAGIFADMSVDGPQIGTLVMVVDRAKNLPNRKTIGKQDPYCAARLGKEAKKTATDIRGGQTPKWDQELRFTVHDSPDYYQLKMSVFTDDKKTELIGDAWIDLKGIVVPGGGQSDMWQSLSCKGKYAGEIRVEITYYDSRPKPDKPAASKRRQYHAQAQPQQSPPMVPDQDAMLRTPVKRRPLPSDPITGEAPSPQSAGNASPEPLHQTFPRPHDFVPTQSPLQAVEYNTPARQLSDPYSPSQPAGRVDGPRPVHRARNMSDSSSTRQYDERGHVQKGPASPYDRGHHSPLPELYHEMPAREEVRMEDQIPEDACPPPPPAHRSMPSGDSQELVHRGSYEATPQKTPTSTPMRHEVLRNEAHRYSAPSHPGRPVFKPYVPPSSDPRDVSPLDLAPRYHSYDAADDAYYRPMQATVEDAPESPPGARQTSYGHVVAAMSRPHDDEMMFDVPHRTEPMDLRNSPGPSPHFANYSNGRHYQEDDLAEHVQSPSFHVRSPQRHERVPHDGYGSRYDLPDVPASLSPGLDPNLSREISEQMLEQRRSMAQYSPPPLSTPTRGHHKEKAASASYSPYAAGYTARPYERRPEAAENQLVRQGDESRNSRYSIPRKSVSPGPPLAENRLLADTPYSPDSYDALNPGLRAGGPDNERVEVEGKIIMHDGREVDPSDHLPMESWAPEPEPKYQTPTKPSLEQRTRSSPSGAQPMPPSGRRPLRIAAAQPNMVTPPPPHKLPDSPYTASPRGGGGGRGRLQKKTDRGSPWAHSSAASSPLAPVSTDKLQSRKGRFTPGSGGVPRWGSWDCSIENHPQQEMSPQAHSKMGFPIMNGGGHVDVALMREMQGIDIGSGRSRRRGGGY